MQKPQLRILATTKKYDQDDIGYAQDITLTDTEIYSILKLKDAVLTDSITFEAGDQIFFLLDPYRSLFLYYYTLAETITLNSYNCNTTAIKIELDSKPYYSRFYYILIKSWYAQKKEFQWRNLNTLRKRVWINACRGWTYRNLDNYILNKPDKTIVFDGSQVKSQLDLYCYLGEIFIGYAGYMGSNISAVEDVMHVDLKNKKQYSIVLKNLDLMKKTYPQTRVLSNIVHLLLLSMILLIFFKKLILKKYASYKITN